jgi:hypothetical protein
MRVVTLNYSGNTGKSTLARHLLAPRIPNARLIAVETINADAAGDEQYRGKAFDRLSETLLETDAAVIDVGASNVEDFLTLMRRFDGSHEDIDLFVLPVVAALKQQKDTIETIEFLANELGVDAARIRVIFNRVEETDEVDTIFSGLKQYEKDEKKFQAISTPVFANDVYERLKSIDRSLVEVIADENDYRAQVRTATSAEKKERAVRMTTLKRLAPTAQANLDAVFKQLMESLNVRGA